MRLTRLSIEKDRITIVAVALVVIMGAQSYLEAPRDEDPGFLIRIAVVTTLFPGAGPERVERLVTDRVETAVRQIPELRKSHAPNAAVMPNVSRPTRPRSSPCRPRKPLAKG